MNFFESVDIFLTPQTPFLSSVVLYTEIRFISIIAKYGILHRRVGIF